MVPLDSSKCWLFGELPVTRVEVKKGEYWYVLHEVCRVLNLYGGYLNSRTIPKEDWQFVTYSDEKGFVHPRTVVIRESVLYAAILMAKYKSNRSSAVMEKIEGFRSLVCNDILPRIFHAKAEEVTFCGSVLQSGPVKEVQSGHELTFI